MKRTFIIIPLAILFLVPFFAYAQTPFSIEKIENYLHASNEGIAIDSRGTRCTAYTEYPDPSYNTIIPDGWETYLPLFYNSITTPLGTCRTNVSPAVCCRQFGLEVTGSDITYVPLRASTQEVTICDGTFGANTIYCKNREPEIKTASVSESCLYHPVSLVLSSENTRCSIRHEASTVSMNYYVAKEETDGGFGIAHTKIRAVREGECDPIMPIEGDQYPINELGIGIQYNNSFCSTEGKNPVACCTALGLKYIKNPGSHFFLVVGVGSLLFLVILTLACVWYLCYKQRLRNIPQKMINSHEE